MCAARRTGVACVSGKTTSGNSVSTGRCSSRLASAPSPDPTCAQYGWAVGAKRRELTPFKCKHPILPRATPRLDEVSGKLAQPRSVPGKLCTHPQQSVSSGPPPLPRTTISKAASGSAGAGPSLPFCFVRGVWPSCAAVLDPDPVRGILVSVLDARGPGAKTMDASERSIMRGAEDGDDSTRYATSAQRTDEGGWFWGGTGGRVSAACLARRVNS